MVDLSIVIVNFNGSDLLQECLQSIYDKIQSIMFEVIVVDNASTDDSFGISKQFPLLKWLQNSSNEGFSRANNQGASIAAGKFLLLLNNDTVMPADDFFNVLANFADKKLGLIGLGLCNPDGTFQSQGSVLSNRFWLTDKPKTVDFVIGAAMVVPRELYLRLGGFDEHFKFYNEDLDLCKRIRGEGLNILYYPLQKIKHYGASAKKYVSTFAIIEGYSGGIYFFSKHYGNTLLPFYKIIVLADLLFKILLSSFKKLYDPQAHELIRMRDAYIDTIRLVMKNK